MSSLDDVYKLADDIGLDVSEFMVDAEWHRVPVTGKKKGNLSGAYCLSEFTLRNRSTVIVGMLSNHVTGREESVTLDGIEGVSPEEIAEAKKRARESAEAAKIEKIKSQNEVAAKAENIWSGLPDSGGSEYLKTKGVGANGIRFTRGSIVVPARDIDGKLWTLQFIKGDGTKRFLTGGAKRGRFHLLNKKHPEGIPSVIGIAEGYSTGVSVHEHLSRSLYLAIAFDAGNILPVGEALRSRYPDSRLIFFADHDVYNGYPQAFIRRRDCTPAVRVQIDRLARLRPDVLVEVVTDNDPRLSDRDKHFNTGVTKALLAAAAVNGDVIVPRFINRTINNKEATA